MFEDHEFITNGEIDLKSDRLNNKVALFMGCTLSETMSVVFLSLSIALLIAMLPVWVCFGKFTLGLAAALILLAPIFFILLTKLSRLKRGKPTGYYQQYIKIKLSKLGLIKNSYVMRSGKWATERRLK